MRWLAGLIIGSVLALAPTTTSPAEAAPAHHDRVLVPLAGDMGVYQPERSQWCVPASVATALRAFGERHDVREVAQNLGQPEQDMGSTRPRKAVAYLNFAQYEHTYSGRVWAKAARFRQRALRMIDNGDPVIVFTSAYHLPGYHTSGNRGLYHAMTLVGYSHTERGLRWQVWDPEIGFEWMRAPVLYNAMRHHYLGAYAIS